ncbi:MAG: NAD(P)H-binding protein [Phycisphaerales bacterium]|nr:NAD(P)H-binding protein [Phycisphaerales bacterium]
MQTVAVTGASGFVGRYVVRELRRRGHAVRALVRDRAAAKGALAGDDSLRGGLTVVEGDVLDGRGAAELVNGADACVHLIGIIREGPDGQTFQRMHVDAVRVMIEACGAAGAGRFVHVSALGVGPEGRSAYQKTKYEGERLVRRSGRGWTVFRPSFIHGAEGEFVQMVKGMASGQEAPWYFMPYFTRSRFDERVPLGGAILSSASVQPVFVEDVAKAVAEALERPETVGEVYNLVGPDVMSWPEVLKLMRAKLPGANHKMPIAGVPGELSVLGAKVAKMLGLGGVLPFDEGQAIMAMEDSTSEMEKARAHLGLTPRPFREALLEYAART